MTDWSLFGKDKNKLLYVREKSGVTTVVSAKKLQPNITKVGLKGHTFPFDSRNPSFRIKNTFYYVVDLDKGQLSFKTEKFPVSPKLWDAVMNQQIVKDLVTGLQNQDFKQLLFYIVIGLITALPLGYIIGNFLPFSK